MRISAPSVALRVAATALVLAAAGQVARGDERTPESRASVELVASPATCYVNQPVHLRFRITVDAAWFAEHGVEMFRRPLDVPVQVEAPWLESPPGLVLGDPSVQTPAAELRRVALGDDVAGATESETLAADGTRLRVLEVARMLLLEEPGEIVLAAPRLRFAWSDRFDDDLVHGRTARERRDAVVAGSEVRIRVLPLPEEGRPQGFTGAVGRFTVRAGVRPAEAEVGGSVRITWTAEGDGNLGRFDAPRLAGLAGFHVLGALDDRGWRRRTVTFDAVPTDPSVVEVPPIELPVFDPGPPAGYRILRTDPVPIHILAKPGSVPEPTTADAPAPPAVVPETGPDAADDTGSVWPLVAALAVLAAAAAGLLLVARRRLPRPGPALSQGEVVGAAAASFRARRSAPGRDLAADFAEFLATVLGCEPAAVISPGVRDRLAAAGTPPDLAERAASLLERLVAARYGGDDAPDAGPAAEAVADALASLAGRPGGLRRDEGPEPSEVRRRSLHRED